MHKSGVMPLAIRGAKAEETAIRKNLSRYFEMKGRDVLKLGPLAQTTIGQDPFFSIKYRLIDWDDLCDKYIPVDQESGF